MTANGISAQKKKKKNHKSHRLKSESRLKPQRNKYPTIANWQGFGAYKQSRRRVGKSPLITRSDLVVTRVGRAIVAVAILGASGTGAVGRGGVLVATEPAEPGLLVLGLGTVQLDVTGGRVTGQSVAASVKVVLVAREPVATAAGGVAVGRGGTEALLALVVTGQEDLEKDGDKEQET